MLLNKLQKFKGGFLYCELYSVHRQHRITVMQQ